MRSANTSEDYGRVGLFPGEQTQNRTQRARGVRFCVCSRGAVVSAAAYVFGMSKSKASSGGGFGGLLVLALIIWVIVKLIWWIVGAAALVAMFFVVRAIVRENGNRADLRAAHRAAVRMRADQQHNWVLQGDDRGIYGPEGAELMHYLYPERERVKAGLLPSRGE